MFARGEAALRAGHLDTDPFLQHPTTDHRRGLTLLLPITGAVATAIAQEQAALQALEPHVYCYPTPDLHLTWLTLLTAQQHRTYSAAGIRPYAELVRQLLEAQPAFGVVFEGLSLSAGAVVAQGFPEPPLQHLRDTLRHAAAEARLPLEERYHSLAAHTTIVRFPGPLRQPAAVADYVRAQRQLPLGTLQVREAWLVWNDWYNRRATRRLLLRCPLRA